MRDDLLHRLSAIEPGDHLCCIYESEQEHNNVLAPFLRQGLEKDEKVLYIVDAHTAEEVLDYLRGEGVDARPYLESGQLSILEVGDSYMKRGVFDPDGMIALLGQETDKALAEGYSALRVTGEMSWALRGLPGSERLIEYEAKLNRFFPGKRCLALCQYDRRRFSPQILLYVLATHPMAVIGTRVYDNFYYMPAEEFLGDSFVNSVLDHWLENLEARSRIEEALVKHAHDLRERIKELNCLYELADIVEKPGITLEEILREAVRVIPSGWQFPEVTCARITYGDREYVSGDFEETEWRMESDIFLLGEKAGSLEVFYLEEKPEADVGAFLDDEVKLAVAICERLSRVAERIWAEEALMSANRELEAYAGMVSHDLRGPISVIISAAQNLAELLEEDKGGDLAEQYTELADVIERSAANAEKLIDALLELARAGQVPGEISEVDILDVVGRVLGERSEIIERRGFRIMLDDDLGRIKADATQIYQLFANLISNAVNYNDSPEPEITISLKGVDGGKRRYLIRDNGSGIAPEDMDHIFEAFYKGKLGDTGIGLATARKIVDVYGGEIRAYNDGGACFEFTLGDLEVA